MNKKTVLLICPPSVVEVFGKKQAVVARAPYLSLASLAGELLRSGHDAHILDLSLSEDVEAALARAFELYQPDIAGITFTTPLAVPAMEAINKIKKMRPEILMLAGGVHATTLPEDVLKNSSVDIVVMGEGEKTLLEICEGASLQEMFGVAYRQNNEIKINPRRPLISDLDSLPYPAWHLYDIEKYRTAPIVTKGKHIGIIETSRGCVFGCNFCNKTVFSRLFRAKSAERVVDEIEYVLKFGFDEIHVMDDMFSTDLERAKKICRLIIKRGIKFVWNAQAGLRVDCIDEELLRLMKEAGCYATSIGIESGNQDILNLVNKGITLDKVRSAVKLIKKVGLQTTGFFILGLDGETEKTLQDTIDFAKELQLDFPKTGILVPLPGTPVFQKWEAEGRIKSRNWSHYIFHPEQNVVYDHPNLKFEVVSRYYNKFYRELYFNAGFIWRRFLYSLKNGKLFSDTYYFFQAILQGWIKTN
jgi:radical SAM superfamily enzyme YgiQ (UPF0313 family)